MIIIKIMGGLGNQMFQYALAEAFSQKGVYVELDTSYYDKIPDVDTQRKCELERISSEFNIVSSKMLKKYDNLWVTILDLIKDKLQIGIPKKIVEKNHFFQQALLDYDNKYLVGYWQCEKYFSNIRERLLKKFSFDLTVLSDQNSELLRKIKNDINSVSLHVRAGDYYNSANASIFGGICTQEYYERAFEYMLKYNPNSHFYLFTNDLNWVNNNLNFREIEITIIDWNNEEDGWIDMCLMSACHNNIIANSSFSWWGAWLNQNRDKIVISPQKWDNSGMENDIIPEGWVTL